jgi:hypothetical protein
VRKYADMKGSAPKWMTSLALDVYKVIQEYDALGRFREMVDRWASSHERDIRSRLEWEERRKQHFERLSLGDLRLRDESAGPPEQGWKWEMFILHRGASREARADRDATIVGWVPPDLSFDVEPEINHPLPLSADHQLTVEEKYVILAAVYDVGRKGTERIPPWEWPDDWGDEGALSNAKKSLSFEGIRQSVWELNADDEGWLRALLDSVTKDIESQRGPATISTGKDMLPDGTRVERCIRKAKNHPVVSVLIIAGVVIVALGAVAGGLDTIINFCGKYLPAHQVPRAGQSGNIFERPIVSATAGVEIDIRSEEQINSVHNMNVGIFLAFAKGRDALLQMTSADSHARRIGDGVIRYSGSLEMALTDKAFKKSLSILRDAQYVQVQVEAIPRNSEVLSGTINCAFDGVPVTLNVPPQKMQENRIFVRNINLAELLKQK